MKKTLLLFLFLFVGHCFSWAVVKLPAIFSDNMVIKQQSRVLFWGDAKPNATVTITTSWSKESFKTTTDAKGTWSMHVSTPDADLKSHQVTISDGAPITLSGVLLGEVWLCSGQSNMEMPMKGYGNSPVIGAAEAIATSQNPYIRYAKIVEKPVMTPTTMAKIQWVPCSPNTVPDFSAAAYYFARQLYATMGVPVGLIEGAWGGSHVEAWMSRETLQQFPTVNVPSQNEPITNPAATPTCLYNSRICPIIGYALSGCIWYQGESNINNPQGYIALLHAMVDEWRTQWKSDFPFYMAQIAPFEYGNWANSAYMREAQLKCAEVIPNAGIAILSDVGIRTDIHPYAKQQVGERLAYLALNRDYGYSGIACEGPIFDKLIIKDNQAIVTFKKLPVGNGITSYDQEITGLEIAGADQQFYPAKGQITYEGLAVSSDQVADPVAVRYGFQNWFKGSLYSVMGLPASSFRTDNW